MKRILPVFIGVLMTASVYGTVKKDKEGKPKGDTIITSSLVNGLKFRSIGPA